MQAAGGGPGGPARGGGPVTPKDPSLESLRVDPGSFKAMVDRSAGGPHYRGMIAVLKGVILVVSTAAVVGVLVVLVALNRFSRVVDRLDAGAAEAEQQRALLVEQSNLLVECLTISPEPGKELNEADRVHECQIETEGLRGAAAGRVIQANLRIHECLDERAPDLRACLADKGSVTTG